MTKFEKFKDKAEQLHSSKYGYFKDSFTNMKTPMVMYCKIHGTFNKTPSDHIGKRLQGCPTCAREHGRKNIVQKSSDKFFKLVKRLYPEYDFKSSKYINTTTKVQAICPIHGKFKKYPGHFSTGGCQKCSIAERARKNTRSLEEVITSFKSTHGDTYNYSLVDYKGSEEYIDIICNKHGVFKQHPASHQRGHGCPECSVTGFNPLRPAILYYLKVIKGDVVCYKVGITNLSVRERFGSDMKYITILREWRYAVGADAYQAEQNILELNRAYKYKGECILRSGNTELFTKDIGGFDV